MITVQVEPCEQWLVQPADAIPGMLKLAVVLASVCAAQVSMPACWLLLEETLKDKLKEAAAMAAGAIAGVG